MTLETLLWIVTIVAIHTFGLFMGYITASNKERVNTAQFVSMALELMLEKAKEIKASNDHIDKRLIEITEHFDKARAEFEAKQ